MSVGLARGNTPTSAGAQPATPQRVEIQALRALSVGAVLAYHLWPAVVPGGYVGVDAFFVISGFLITAHLLREVDRTGTVSLARFWARRVRRLLPASLLVATATATAVLLVVPVTVWGQFFRDIVAASVYVLNWWLARQAVDYLAAGGIASPVQHFWSLSLEEQFYLVWPLLVIAAMAVARRESWSWRRTLAVTLVSVTAVSFALGVVMTWTHPAEAYFLTPTRAWQFGLGGLLALACARRGLRPVVSPALASVASWAGIGLILTSCFVYGATTPFPGIAALLPVAGVLLVIAAGEPRHPLSPMRVYDARGVQWLGKVSYSAYLWHWPPIVILPYMLGRPLDLPWSLTILAGTLVLAELTHRFVEDPVRWAPFLTTRSPAVTFGVLFAAAAVALIPAVGGLATLELEKREDARIIAASDGLECFGADAVGPDGTLCQPPGLAKVVPGPGVATDDVPSVYNDRCRVETDEPGVKECVISDADGDVRIAAVGDSHLAQWVTPLADLGVERGWHVTLFFKAACPFSAAADSVRTAESDPATCADWNESVEERLLKGGFDGVITSASAQYVFDGGSSAESATAGYRERWQVLTSSGMPVAVLSDSPQVPQATIDCVGDVANPASDCGWPAGRATARTHVLEDAARGLSDVEYVDLTDHFCVSGTCPAVVGSVLVYRDESSHVTDTYARTLLPHLEMALKHFAASVR